MKSLQERIVFPVVLGSISAILIALIWFRFLEESEVPRKTRVS